MFDNEFNDHRDRRTCNDRRSQFDLEHELPCTHLTMITSRISKIESEVESIHLDTKEQNKLILDEILSVKLQLSTQKGFYAGMLFVITGIVSLVISYFK